MEDQETWPKGSYRDDLADSKKLLEFLDKEILTLEFVQGIDPEIEHELARTIRDYQRTKKQITEAAEAMRKRV